MWFHRLTPKVRPWLPRMVFEAIRRTGTAVLTPLVFSSWTGHFRSALMGRAMTWDGRPLPWFTYPAISLLAHQEFAGRRVLEWGAGQSTLWWATRAAHVTAFEFDREWYDYLIRRIPATVTLRLVASDLVDLDLRSLVPPYDVIVIDGLDRFRCAEVSVDLLTPDGAIILDNAEGHWNAEGRWGAPGTYPIIDLFRGAGYERVDLYGFCPGVIRPHCTSIFFRSPCFLFAGQRPPARELP